MKVNLAFQELQLLLNHEQQLRLARVEVNEYGSDKYKERIKELRTFVDSQEDQAPIVIEKKTEPVDPQFNFQDFGPAPVKQDNEMPF